MPTGGRVIESASSCCCAPDRQPVKASRQPLFCSLCEVVDRQCHGAGHYDRVRQAGHRCRPQAREDWNNVLSGTLSFCPMRAWTVQDRRTVQTASHKTTLRVVTSHDPRAPSSNLPTVQNRPDKFINTHRGFGHLEGLESCGVHAYRGLFLVNNLSVVGRDGVSLQPSNQHLAGGHASLPSKLVSARGRHWG